MKFCNLKRMLQTVALAGLTTSAYAVTDISTCQTISQPGSYRVTQNLHSVARDCLVITAPSVTIDLQGHHVSGTRTPRTAGVSTPPELRLHDIVVRNGTISHFSTGVSFSELTHGLRVDGLQVHSNSTLGIHVGAGAIVSSNVVHDNGGFGILVRSQAGVDGDGSLISGNLVFDNEFDGIASEERGSLIMGNVVRRNGNNGIRVVCPSNIQNNTSSLSPTGFFDIRFSDTTCSLVNNVAPKVRRD